VGNSIRQTDRIGKTFGVVRALSEATLAFYPGECIGVMGHNGAGKSTLMNVLSGVFRHDDGALYVDGKRRGAALEYARGAQPWHTLRVPGAVAVPESESRGKHAAANAARSEALAMAQSKRARS
jgi:ABC-type branched-subunit amino acid transport system ATPase component